MEDTNMVFLTQNVMERNELQKKQTGIINCLVTSHLTGYDWLLALTPFTCGMDSHNPKSGLGFQVTVGKPESSNTIYIDSRFTQHSKTKGEF